MTQESGKTLSLKFGKDKNIPTQLQEQLQLLKDAFPSQPQTSKKKEPSKKKNEEETDKEKNIRAKQHAISLKKIQQEANRQRFQKMQKALQWLQETYPECFNLQSPKPLKIRIEKDIFASLPEGLPFPRLAIRRALGYYTKSSRYQEALSTSIHRYDLQGNVDGEVIPFASSSTKT